VKIAIVVASATGRTRRLAEAFAEGVAAEGGEALMLEAEAAGVEDLRDADALVLGCGVHMSGVPSAMRGFLERLAPQWMSGALVGRLGAAFVSAGAGARGGGELALIELHAALAQHGLLLVSMPNRTKGFSSGGSHWGPVAWTHPRSGEAGPTAGHLEAARGHGRHVARSTARWLRGAQA
jgi:NAD(P)H dehydrogenase (quinone)